MRHASLCKKLSRSGGDSAAESLKDLDDDEFGGGTVGAFGVNHEANAEEADEEAEEEEPLRRRKTGSAGTSLGQRFLIQRLERHSPLL